MLDFGLFTLPAIAAAMVFVTALFVGEDIVIEKIYVPTVREWSGYTSTVATRQLSDELREMSVAAASELQAVNIDEGGVEKGISAFEDYFQVGLLINGTRNVLGLIKYYINGEITEIGGDPQMMIRVYTKKEDNPVKLIVIKGQGNDIDAMLHEGAVQILEFINPYVIALYHRRIELEQKQYDFPKTHETIDKFLRTQPNEQHFLAYGLLGRMHMLKAERDTALTPEQREAEYKEAERHLQAALLQQPEFLYPLINMGIIRAGKKDYAAADGYFARAVKAKPNYLITRTAWGDMLTEQGLLDDAIIQYVAAVEIDPHDAKLRAKLADLYERAGRPVEAREQAEVALKLEPISEAYVGKVKELEEKSVIAQ
ncbi:MAG TPA: tetratricopeptide repeat protein [Ancylobacter sp.]